MAKGSGKYSEKGRIVGQGRLQYQVRETLAASGVRSRWYRIYSLCLVKLGIREIYETEIH